MFASQAALVIANARTPPGGAAGPDRPGDPDQHLAGGRRGVRRQDGRSRCRSTGRRKGIVDGPAGTGPVAGATAGGADRPAGRRAGGLPHGIAPGPGAQHRRGRCGPRRSCSGFPTGRSVTTLINATPIRPEGGGIESYVVTLQDLTALEELERLRAEFLAMVSHELRTPLTSVKGAVTSLLDPAAGLNPIETAPVLPDHRRPGRPDAPDDQRPAGRGPHRDRGPVGVPGAGGGGVAGERGRQRLPVRRGPPQHRHRPGPRSCPG